MYSTMTGVAVNDIPARLQAVFTEQGAYKGVPGGADLTDINTGFMLERITEVFGIKGWGWNFTFKPEDMAILGESGRVTAHLRYAEFSYCLGDEEGKREWFVIPTGGMNTNKIEYVEEGARTSALGAALKGMTFQVSVYKGVFDHHDADKAIADTNKAEAARKAAEARMNAPKATMANKPAVETPAKANGAKSPAPAENAPQPVSESPAGDDELVKARATLIPQGVPLAGKTLGEAMNDKVFGVFVVQFLAGDIQNRAGQWYTPATEADKQVVEYAKLLSSQIVSSN